MIHPLGEQILIRAVPFPDRIGSIVIPDDAKSSTLEGSKGGAGDVVHYVEAEVVAVGPGKHGKGDPKLVEELARALQVVRGREDEPAGFDVQALVIRARADSRVPMSVRAGDRILYHPSVARFDRKLDPLPDWPAGDYYIILENSVLAVIEP